MFYRLKIFWKEKKKQELYKMSLTYKPFTIQFCLFKTSNWGSGAQIKRQKYKLTTTRSGVRHAYHWATSVEHQLNHFITTNSRLFQIERVCRRQIQSWWKWQKVLQTDRKHCGKRRNCLLRAISPFPTVFSKDFYGRHVKKPGLFREKA